MTRRTRPRFEGVLGIQNRGGGYRNGAHGLRVDVEKYDRLEHEVPGGHVPMFSGVDRAFPPG